MAKPKKPARQDAAESPQELQGRAAPAQDESPEPGAASDFAGADCGHPSGAPLAQGSQEHEPVEYDPTETPAQNVERALESPPAEEDGTPAQLRADGPTLEEYVAAGYAAETYPPSGYAAVSSEAPRYRPRHRTLTQEVAQLAREAFKSKDFVAHGELHQVEMAIAHLRHTMTVARGRLKGEARELLEQLLEGL